jgi:hypothetical protein
MVVPESVCKRLMKHTIAFVPPRSLPLPAQSTTSHQGCCCLVHSMVTEGKHLFESDATLNVEKTWLYPDDMTNLNDPKTPNRRSSFRSHPASSFAKNVKPAFNSALSFQIVRNPCLRRTLEIQTSNPVQKEPCEEVVFHQPSSMKSPASRAGNQSQNLPGTKKNLPSVREQAYNSRQRIQYATASWAHPKKLLA